MGRLLRLSDQADGDLVRIWAYTAETYDIDQAIEYSSLIDCALGDIEADPERPTSRSHPEYGVLVRSYHIEYSKRRSGTRVRNPRHVIYYTLK
jgi:plasmid stabilization system protein ParE